MDSIGPLANSVACCAAVDAILAGEAPRPVAPMDLRAMRLAVPGNVVMDGMEPAVAEVFGRALNRLASLGVRVTHLPFPAFKQVLDANAAGGFAAAEAYAWHRALLARGAARYDPRVRVRIERGAGMSAADLIALQAARPRIIAAMDEATAPFDAVAMPTCPIVPPPIADLADDDAFTRTNVLALRNTALGNFLDRCAISLPAHRPGEPPVGFLLMGETGGRRPAVRHRGSGRGRLEGRDVTADSNGADQHGLHLQHTSGAAPATGRRHACGSRAGTFRPVPSPGGTSTAGPTSS